jgi:hypothetical protein
MKKNIYLASDVNSTLLEAGKTKGSTFLWKTAFWLLPSRGL